MLLVVITLEVILLLKITLMVIVLTLITVIIPLVLILLNLVLTRVEIPLVVKTLVHSVLVLILVKVLVSVLTILVLGLIKSRWSNVVIGTITQQISVPLWLVRITSRIVGTLGCEYVLLSEATGGWALMVRVWTTTGFTTDSFNLLIVICLVNSENRSRQIIKFFGKSSYFIICRSD